jgi:RNA polymerase sigma-70 factor (sigma-E family)
MADEVRREVFEEFARARMPELLRFGHALTGSPHAAADLVQDALERTMLAWGRVENQGDPEGYVRRIMVNRNISIWRRQRRETLVLDVPEDAGRRGAGPTEPGARDVALWDGVKALPPRQRTVIVLRYYEDMHETQIAVTMGCARGTVKSLASRALSTLRRDAAALGGEEIGVRRTANACARTPSPWPANAQPSRGTRTASLQNGPSHA